MAAISLRAGEAVRIHGAGGLTWSFGPTAAPGKSSSFRALEYRQQEMRRMGMARLDLP
jgi:hypothetical protein